MKTLGRYLSRQILLATGFVLVAFLGLFAFFDLISELGDVGKARYGLLQAFAYVLLSIPGHIYELFPIVVLIGTLYALADLAAKSEYTVMRTAGLSAGAAARGLLPLGMAFVLATAVVGELVTPFAERMAQAVRVGAMGAVLGQELRSGVWVKSESRIVNIGTVRADATVANVRIYDFDDAFRLRSISDAAEGRYEGGNVWELSGVVATRFGDGGAFVERVPEIRWTSVLTPDLLSVLTVEPQKMSAWDLFQYTRHLSRNNQRTERYEIALWKKVLYPFATLVMMALALPFAYVQARQGAIGIKIFAGIMIGVVFHGLNSLASHLGVLQGWPPLVSAVLPSAVFSVAAVAMLWWVERR
ncbi:MAG: LPS export ABC transporter permease LptG [Burkholderiales bacterium]|jgi:lipopolysaccharide export system permease protein|nr:LPS export ABC transporter permease LptG [Burkholderiales bacterium]